MTGVDAITLRGVSHRFGDHLVVDDVDLTVAPGECFGLLGPNGAGKTTTIRLITTLLPVQQGEVLVFGTDVRRKPMVVRRLLGYVPQQLSIEGALTGRENVSWFARLFDVPQAGAQGPGRRGAERWSTWTTPPTGSPRRTPGGMVRRLELAQALVNRPALLVLDEPTVGLDPVARDSVWARVGEMQQRYGMTVLLTTHYMEEAEALCDRVALMHQGAIQALGAPVDLQAGARPGVEPRGRLPALHRQQPDREREGRPAGCPQYPPHRPPSGLRSTTPGRRRPAAVPDRHVLPGRAAAAQARPQRAGDQGDPADALAADLRHHVQPDPRDPDRRRAVPGLPRAGDHGPVRAVHRDLLRHPDHLGAGRRRAHQAAGHADAAGRAGRREGVRVRGTGDHPGRRRARRRRAARGRR